VLLDQEDRARNIAGHDLVVEVGANPFKARA
jgi:hypothetical protein